MDKILIFGLKKSGKALYDLLKSDNEVWLYDDDCHSIDSTWANTRLLKTMAVAKSVHTFDYLIYTPSIPRSNWLLRLAEEYGVPIYNEFEFGFNSFRNKSVCVTGTDGKSTTVKMIEKILESGNVNFKSFGNIGVPVCSICKNMNENDIAVAEVSSFMLSGEVGIHPDIAVVTNISADHLDWHKSFKEYVFAKAAITKKQNENDWLIINADDEVCSFLTWQTKAKTLFFSLYKKVNGAYLNGENLEFCIDGNPAEKIVSVSQLKFNGAHNVYNALSAALACRCLGVSTEKIAEGLSNFCGLKHRQQVVGEINGISFINDSKATTPQAVLAALAAYKHFSIGLILGGSEKKLDYDKIFEFRGVFWYCFIGKAADSLALCAVEHGLSNFDIVSDIQTAVEKLYEKLSNQKGQRAILLSPACASFDAYENFEERGDDFVRIIGELKNVKRKE